MAPLPTLRSRTVLFFGGKGGVGKTTLAAVFALKSADEGVRTLLVSTDPAHSTGDVLHTPLGPEPTDVVPNLTAVEIDPTLEADRYVAGVKRRIADVTPPRLVAEVERQIDIARVTPGAEEAALFERFTRLMDGLGSDYDRLVFDTAPLGQTLRLLSLPEQMSAWMSGLIGRRRQVNVVGRMWRTVAGAAAGDALSERDPVLATLEERRDRFIRARTILTDRRRAAFVFVTIAERLAVLETEKGVAALEKFAIPVGAVIVNRLVADVAAVSPERRRGEARQLERIRERLGGYPIYLAPA
ncbi:MAG: TRC40/GET3/ArsA family transport-energizing ATPase, partial [Gemmatimonadales bacterium]